MPLHLFIQKQRTCTIHTHFARSINAIVSNIILERPGLLNKLSAEEQSLYMTALQLFAENPSHGANLEKLHVSHINNLLMAEMFQIVLPLVLRLISLRSRFFH